MGTGVGEMFITGLVLAAGGSSRLGQPKQLLPYKGRPLLDVTLAMARRCGFDQLLVTIGGASEEVRDRIDFEGCDVVENVNYGAGCSSSIGAAMGAVDERSDGVVLLLGDQPDVSPAVVETLVRTAKGAPLGVTLYEDGTGSPVLVRPPGVRRTHGAARRQGRLEAPRIRALPRHRGKSRGPNSARCRHVGGLPGAPGGVG